MRRLFHDVGRALQHVPAAVVLTVVIAGCGSAAERQTSTTSEQSARPAPAPASASASASAAAVPQSHPQAIQPAAGVQAVPSSEPAAPVVGDPTAHAPSLAQVKRELKQLNLCGGVSNSADAAPIAIGRGPGFVADPGTSQSEGQLPRLTAQLDALGRALGITIYGISGYRTPAHSVAVGGFADDPHTRGEAEDVGVNSLLRSSAAQISEAELARYGLYRPFDPSDDPGNTEVNHIQLIPSGGPLTLAQSTATFDPDPSCK